MSTVSSYKQVKKSIGKSKNNIPIIYMQTIIYKIKAKSII